MPRYKPKPHPVKNPGALAGATGASKGSAGWRELTSPYPHRRPRTRLTLRSIISDEGHFQGLEIAS